MPSAAPPPLPLRQPPSDECGGIERIGDAAPATPVVISVPHAGQVYPPALLAALRCPATTLVALEDRCIDAVARAARRDETLLIQRRGRAWIDLNRGEDERDPHVDAGAPRGTTRSAKVHGGLGLVPRRAGRIESLWSRRFTGAEIEQRLAEDHRPYHAALAQALARARAAFGTAVLVDLHSMPPLGPERARVVIGDRFGRSAAARFVARAEAAVAPFGWRAALNSPYPGGHIVERHGAPHAGIHALQVELDRTLYLDAALDRPGDGLAASAAMVSALCAALADEATGAGFAVAAE